MIVQDGQPGLPGVSLDCLAGCALVVGVAREAQGGSQNGENDAPRQLAGGQLVAEALLVEVRVRLVVDALEEGVDERLRHWIWGDGVEVYAVVLVRVGVAQHFPE